MKRLLQLKPSLRRADSKHGLVMLKLLDKASDELRILQFLNGIKSGANHVIPLLDFFHYEIGTVVALPIASPLDARDFTGPSVTLDLMYQLLEAVAFIHANRVAHLDLKPRNLLVSHTGDRPRLVMIDFDVSVSVDSPDTQIEGFVGTPPWVAPEVGTEHGPPQKFSPVRADLWACGQLLYYMSSRSCVRDPVLLRLADGLSSNDPFQRPLLHAGDQTHIIKMGNKHSLSHDKMPLPKRLRADVRTLLEPT
jgi:serine/threonine protein kinase